MDGQPSTGSLQLVTSIAIIKPTKQMSKIASLNDQSFQ
jgi:hypothetical protein